MCFEKVESYLTTSIRPHGNVAVRSARETWVNARAECRLALLAILTTTVCDVEWHDNAVSFLEKCDARTNIFYDTHVLVAWTLSVLASRV